jgi:hypothetical protein
MKKITTETMKATPIALKVAKNAVREWGRESLRVPMAEEVKEIITLTATRREGPVTHNL